MNFVTGARHPIFEAYMVLTSFISQVSTYCINSQPGTQVQALVAFSMQSD